MAGSSNQPSPLYPHGADNPDEGEGVPLCSAVYLNPMAWLSAERVFIAFCRHESFKDTSIMCVHIFTLDMQ